MMMPHKRGGRTYKNGGSVAPQYPQTVKTASKQDLKSNLRKNGGRTYDAGSVSGEGRLEKIRNYGRKAHMKAKAV